MIPNETKFQLIKSCILGLKNELQKELQKDFLDPKDTLEWVIDYLSYCLDVINKVET